MHSFSTEVQQLAGEILAATERRLRDGPADLGSTASEAELRTAMGVTITDGGIGGQSALRLFLEIAEPACISIDHPLELAFVPAAPTKAALLFDALLGAISIDASTWLEGSGAIHLENQILAWLAGLAGMGGDAGGCFVPGGTVGNLSALVAAREDARAGERPTCAVLAAASRHSSIASAANVMNAEIAEVPSHDGLRITADSVAAVLDRRDDVFAVVATAGTTSTGSIDDLHGIGNVCRDRGIWFHVDAAYGGAGLLSEQRHLYHGIDQADSLIIDPHKWLFAPYDSCALVYRQPQRARRAHRQLAGYLDDRDAVDGWNPSDYAIHLSRRARGLPLWFSVAAHGTSEYRRAVDQTLSVAAEVEALIEALPHVQMACERTLTILVFRFEGWIRADYENWARTLRSGGHAFVSTTLIDEEMLGRICIVNPTTRIDDVAPILTSPHPTRGGRGARS